MKEQHLDLYPNGQRDKCIRSNIVCDSVLNYIHFEFKATAKIWIYPLSLIWNPFVAVMWFFCNSPSKSPIGASFIGAPGL